MVYTFQTTKFFQSGIYSLIVSIQQKSDPLHGCIKLEFNLILVSSSSQHFFLNNVSALFFFREKDHWKMALKCWNNA